MIKVELFYKVSMFGSDWMMTEEEYEEFRQQVKNLPEYYPVFTVSPMMAPPPVEEDQAEECPNIIEPSESESSSVAIGIDVDFGPLIVNAETDEKVQKTTEKAQKEAEKAQKEVKNTKKAHDLTPYIKMYTDGIATKEIKQRMQVDLDISAATADNYFYTKVKAKAPGKKEKVKDPALQEDISYMPDYATYTDFKDACAAADIGRGKYTIQVLKDIYLRTHPHIKW